MTTTFSSPPLERPHDTPLAGVCTALARTTGTGPVLWRVLAVVLSFFGGLGVALYLAGVVLIRAEGQQQSIAQRLLNGPDRRLSGRQVTAVALLLVCVAVLAGHADGLVALAVGAGLALLWVRGPRDPGRAGHAGPVPDAAAGVPSDAPAGAATGSPFDTLTVEPPPAASTPRRRSPLVPVTLSLALVTAALLALLGVTVTSVPVEVALAAALGVVGLGLLSGARLGAAPGLVVVAVLLAAALAGALALRPVADRGAGDPTWRPSGSTAYQLGAGDATLDLTGLVAGAGLPARVSARVEVGHLLVVVPDGLRARVDGRARLGEVVVLGQRADGRDAARTADLGPAGPPDVTLDLRVGLGQIEVRRG